MTFIYILILLYVLFKRKFLYKKWFSSSVFIFLIVIIASLLSYARARYVSFSDCRNISTKNVIPIFYICECGNNKKCKFLTHQPIDVLTGNDKNYIFVSNGISGKGVSKININNKNDVLTIYTDGKPERLSYCPQKDELYVGVYNRQKGLSILYIISGDKFTVKKSIHSKKGVAYFNSIPYYEKKLLFVLSDSKDFLTSYDLTNFEYKMSIPIKGSPAYVGSPDSIDINKKNKNLYVISYSYGSVYKIDYKTLKINKKVKIASSLFHVLVDKKNNEVYVSAPLKSKVFVLDGDNLEIKKAYNTGFGVREFAIDFKKDLLFIGTYFDGNVRIIDMKKNKIISEYMLGPLLRSIYYDFDTEKLFVTSGCGIFEIKYQNNIKNKINSK